MSEKDTNFSKTVTNVIKKIRKEILNGTLKKGDRLIQDEWARKLNVSRMPIREALTYLEMEGLVENVPNKGAIVTPITKEDIEEIYQLRSLLEGVVVEQSLPYITDEDVQTLEQILIQMETLVLTDETEEEYSKLNARFHEILHKECPWGRAKKYVDNLGISPIAPKLLAKYHKRTQEDHRRIYEAVVRRDVQELKLAMELHLLRTKNNLIETLKEMN